MKVVLAGSRDIFDPSLLELAIIDSGYEITEVVCGKALGVDTLGEEWAKANNIPVKDFEPDWKSHPFNAGFIRNGDMAEYADAAIILHNGSNGSANMMSQMRSRRKPYYSWNIKSGRRGHKIY